MFNVLVSKCTQPLWETHIHMIYPYGLNPFWWHIDNSHLSIFLKIEFLETKHTSCCNWFFLNLKLPVVCLICLQCFGILSYLVWAWSGASFAWFLLARVFSGMSRANIACLSAMVSDVSGREARTQGMAAVGVAYSLAFLIGPPVSALLMGRLFNTAGTSMGVLGPQLGACCALLSTANLLILLALPETVMLKQESSSVSCNVLVIIFS